MLVYIFQVPLRRGSIRFKKVILYLFHTIFSAFVRSRLAHHPVSLLSFCSSTNSVRCSAGQPVPASITFLHTAHIQRHYANHFPRITHLVIIAVPYFPFRGGWPTFLLVSRCLDHSFVTFDFESTPRDYFAVPFAGSAHHSAHFGPPSAPSRRQVP